tara:strand:- start:280 stop:1686 length:1407 start_codon:yes stop_codon:yes gene_type:complete
MVDNTQERERLLTNIDQWTLQDIIWMLFNAQGFDESHYYFKDSSFDIHPGKEIVLTSPEPPYKTEGINLDFTPAKFAAKLKVAARAGRFGRLVTTFGESIPWVPEDYSYPSESNTNKIIRALLEFSFHPLRAIDWFKEENIPMLSSFADNPKSPLSKITKSWTSRHSDIPDIVHKIDYELVAREDFWVLTELRVLLFGETFAAQYPPWVYHKYKPDLEAQMKQADKNIENAITKKLVIPNTPRDRREPIMESGGHVKLGWEREEEGEYCGFYGINEIKQDTCRMFEPVPLLKALQDKGYPLENTLIQSLEDKDYKRASLLLQKLTQCMEDFIKHGPTDLNTNYLQKTSPLKAPDGTTWNQIGFTLLTDGSVEVKIKSKVKTLPLKDLTQLMSGNKTRDLLLYILKFSGQFSREQLEGGARENYKSYISALRKDLKTLFQIEEDPIDSTRDGSYTTKFSASCQSPSDSF